MVDYLVSDLIMETQRNIAAYRVDSIDAVRQQPRPLVSLSDEVMAEHQELKRFLRAKLYNHPKVKEVMDEARTTLKELFGAYLRIDPCFRPNTRHWLARAELKAASLRAHESSRTMWRG